MDAGDAAVSAFATIVCVLVAVLVVAALVADRVHERSWAQRIRRSIRQDNVRALNATALHFELAYPGSHAHLLENDG